MENTVRFRVTPSISWGKSFSPPPFEVRILLIIIAILSPWPAQSQYNTRSAGHEHFDSFHSLSAGERLALRLSKGSESNGWGGRIRTSDTGSKGPCLTTWRHPCEAKAMTCQYVRLAEPPRPVSAVGRRHGGKRVGRSIALLFYCSRTTSTRLRPGGYGVVFLSL